MSRGWSLSRDKAGARHLHSTAIISSARRTKTLIRPLIHLSAGNCFSAAKLSRDTFICSSVLQEQEHWTRLLTSIDIVKSKNYSYFQDQSIKRCIYIFSEQKHVSSITHEIFYCYSKKSKCLELMFRYTCSRISLLFPVFLFCEEHKIQIVQSPLSTVRMCKQDMNRETRGCMRVQVTQAALFSSQAKRLQKYLLNLISEKKNWKKYQLGWRCISHHKAVS